ncbi:bifunctional DNA primase/polymerase [Boseaceae bacterium BT-24-1]|nr:bifunctional DNA primase/polymerase [Boseaceae bacterium BT-24-1]
MHSNAKPTSKATDTEGLRSQAVALADQGFRVVPLLPNGKTPAVEGGCHQASSDSERVRRFWSEAMTDEPLDYNIGIATGDGLIVVDIDTKDGKDGVGAWKRLEKQYGQAPRTLAVSTPGRGVHLYFRDGSGRWFPISAGKLGEGLDIRGDGGYVVGPGSIINGKAYEVYDGVPIAPIPEWLVRLIEAPRPSKMVGSVAALKGVDPDIARARVDEWLKNHAELSIEGDGGDTAAYRVAARVMDFGLSPDDALELMLDHWNDRCEPPWEDERLAVIVNNAAAYRQKPIGADSADVEFDVVELAPEDARVKPEHDDMPVTGANTPWQIRMAADVSARALLQSASPLVTGLLDCGAMSMLYAPPGSGKTFLMLSIAYAIASGTAWAGRKCHRGLVIYLVAEGGGGFAKRVMALQKCHGFAAELPLGILQVSADLRSNKVDCKRLIAAVRELESATGEKCVLLVVDTLSRVLAGGDENSSVDGGALIKNLDEIRQAIASHVIVVHHTGKNESKGARGWSGFKAALDTELEIIDKTLHVTKQRDLEFAKPIGFRLESVDLGLDADGAPVSSAIAKMDVAPLEDFGDVLTPAQERMMGALKSAAAKKYGDRYRPGSDAFVLTSKEWDAEFDETGSRHSPIGGRSRQTLDTHRLALVEKTLVKKIKRAQWVALQ